MTVPTQLSAWWIVLLAVLLGLAAGAVIGLISIISVVSIAESLAGAQGAGATALTTQGNSLVHTYDWAFLWGPGLVAGIGNGVLLGYLMYRSGSSRGGWRCSASSAARC